MAAVEVNPRAAAAYSGAAARDRSRSKVQPEGKRTALLLAWCADADNRTVRVLVTQVKRPRLNPGVSCRLILRTERSPDRHRMGQSRPQTAPKFEFSSLQQAVQFELSRSLAAKRCIVKCSGFERLLAVRELAGAP